jgi:hypothetical protein
LFETGCILIEVLLSVPKFGLGASCFLSTFLSSLSMSNLQINGQHFQNNSLLYHNAKRNSHPVIQATGSLLQQEAVY